MSGDGGMVISHPNGPLKSLVFSTNIGTFVAHSDKIFLGSIFVTAVS